MRTKELMLYKNMEDEQILTDMTFLMEHYNSDYCEQDDLANHLFATANQILELSVSHGFQGNLWQDYLTCLLVNSENAYSRSCEVVGQVPGSINEAALWDFGIFKELFDYDFTDMLRTLGAENLTVFSHYEGTDGYGDKYNRKIRDSILLLSADLASAKDVSAFKDRVTRYYKEYGVGKFGLHKAFRVEHHKRGAKIVPINKIPDVCLDDLVGDEVQKKKLIENTEAFVSGRKANNCLLFGDAGTGKSTSIKAILNQYYDRGLRMIEVYKHQFRDLNDVIEQVKSRNYKFIIFMDDLSFEESETEYKYLKAVIEGGLEKTPDNVLIYATSNRRHLIRESYHDRDEKDSEMHTNDTVQEKLSLAARFGVTIYFGKPDRKEFQEIVRTLAERNDIHMSQEDLMSEANKWELSHGGLSGRTAQQFIDYLSGVSFT